MTPAIPTALGLGTLAAAWLGPLPSLVHHSFTAHMALHLAVVALAAPLLAAAAAGTRLDPTRLAPRLMAPLPLSLVELIVVWAWHAPTLHDGARRVTGAFVLEQATFLVAGLLLWASALGAGQSRQAAGIAALLLTAMHMTLLGVLLALAPRPLYAHGEAPLMDLTPLADQQLGGTLMLLVGGVVYLVGGLHLLAGLLRDPAHDEGRG